MTEKRLAARRKSTAKTGPADAGFVLEDYVLYNMVLTAATYNEEMARALKRYRLDTMKWRILMLLNDASPSSVGELARRSVTKMPTLTRVLMRMEDEGLVVRQALADDKRFVQVTMTPKAVKTLKAVKTIGQRVFERAFEGVADAEIAAMTSTLKHVRVNLGRPQYETAAGKANVLRARAS